MPTPAPAKAPTVAEGQVPDMKVIADFASTVFEDHQIAERWLHEPNLATDNRPPIELLNSAEGFSRVAVLLQRIEYGVLA